MQVLRRQTDNTMHLVAFGALALLFGLGRGDVVGIVAAVALGIVAVRGFRNGVYVGAEDVVVRDTFKSRRIPRRDIVRADIDPRASVFGAATVLVLADGERVPLWALQPGRKKGPKMHEAHVAVLQDVQKALSQ